MFLNLVTTVIPVYDRPHVLREATDGVLAQTYRPIQIILVDDGSTDETPQVLDRLAAELPDTIRVVHRENGGPGLAREAGRQLARGEFIQYLDSDDLLLPRKFEVQVRALRDRPECGIAYGVTRLVDAEGKTLREPSKWTGREISYLFPGMLVDHWWHPHTPLYRRSLCDLIGPWPKNQPEDWDYDARAGALRTKLVHCPVPVSCHRLHEGHRVTKWASERYWPQEAWFLPRLYDCALRAGVPREAPEMAHFARWAFSLARRLGSMGHRDLADAMLALAVEAAGSPTPAMRLVRASAGAIGWYLTGRLCGLRDRLLGSRVGPHTLPGSWALL